MKWIKQTCQFLRRLRLLHVIGSIQVAVFFVLVIFLEFYSTPLDHVIEFSRFVAQRASGASFDPHPSFIDRWAVVTIAANITSIAFAITFLLKNQSKSNVEVLISSCLGAALILNILAVFLLPFPWMDLTYVSTVLYLIYCASDIFGWINTRLRSGSADEIANYKYPLLCIDLPCLFFSVYFFLSYLRCNMTYDFYVGASAGLVVFSCLVYAGLTTFILSEEISSGGIVVSASARS